MSQAQAAEASNQVDLNALLEGGAFDMASVGSLLDNLPAPARLAAVRSLGAKAQAHLYDAAKGVRRLTLRDFVPSATPDLTEVVHEGKNSLAMFKTFAKVFCRPKAEARELWGYNRTRGLVLATAGPGYFVAYEGPGDEVLIDYTRVPESKLETWPEIQPNATGLKRLVYGGMVDALRAVSSHVSVGRAIRGGKVADNWFVLCRC